MADALEIAKVLVSPCEKLISATQAAIGKLYEPRYNKRMADAKAYEIQQVGKALAENSDIPIVYDKGSITMDTTDFDALIKRTQSRLAYQELRKQTNIESVLSNAYNHLENEPPVTDDPIDPDWLIRFFNSVEDISNQQMQYLWGKILAGEIKHPNSFSMRTLNVLKNLTQSEAELFMRISPYIFVCPGNEQKNIFDYFIPTTNTFGENELSKYQIPYSDILTLSEAGIINHSANIIISMHLEPEETDSIIGTQGRIECYNGSESPIDLTHGAYVLTESGKELFSIIREELTVLEPEYISDFLSRFKASNSIIETNDSKKNISVKIILDT